MLLLEAIALAQHALPSAYAFSVGALIVDAHGDRIGQGYTHERDPRDHAEEVALAGLGPGWRAPAGATLHGSSELYSVAPAGARQPGPSPARATSSAWSRGSRSWV